MADYTIDKFSYGGNTYNFDKDNFIVHVTMTEVSGGNSYSAAESWSNLVAAYEAGKNIYVLCSYSDDPTYSFKLRFREADMTQNSPYFIFYENDNSFYFSLSLMNGGNDAINISPDTGDVDYHVQTILATTTKAYLLGTSTTPTSTSQKVTTIADTGVYLDTTAGRLTATSFNGSGATLSSLNGSNISSGTIPAARINGATLSSINASNISTGTIPAARINGATLSSINASNISSGTLATARLNTSGVTAGSYGPSADATPAAGSNFSVPYMTVDTYGRVTAAVTRNITMPSVGAAAAKGVDTSIEDGSSSTNLPTSAAVAAYVDAASGGLEVYSGTTEPTSSIGQNGDLYVLIEGNSAGALVYYNSTTGKMQTADGTEVSALSYDVITSW